MRILIAEDEVTIARALKVMLEKNKYAVDMVHNGNDALDYIQATTYDALVLDIMMPGKDGIEVLKAARGSGNTTPALFLTAKAEVADRVAGLDAGADDYLVKPFGAGELLARVRAQLRRQQPASQNEPFIRFSDVCIDPVRRIVEKNGHPVHLTPIEYRILTYMTSQPDKVITHQQLLKAIWGPGHTEDMHYVRVHMANLRKKIEQNGSMPKHLITEAGIGYRFVSTPA